MPVAHRFRHRHYVRHDAVRLERPVVRADPPEADLHLVRDCYAAGLAYRAVKERNPVPSIKLSAHVDNWHVAVRTYSYTFWK